MSVKRISPAEAQDLLAQGYEYLDVRSVPEFDEGHVPGAWNAPLLHLGPGGMAPNADFLAVVSAAFPRDKKLIVGCKSGGRSQRAAMALESAGFTALVEMRGGWSGEGDGMGRLVEKGWSALGYPVARQAEPGRRWDELQKKK